MNACPLFMVYTFDRFVSAAGRAQVGSTHRRHSAFWRFFAKDAKDGRQPGRGDDDDRPIRARPTPVWAGQGGGGRSGARRRDELPRCASASTADYRGGGTTCLAALRPPPPITEAAG